jgi:hypothetical protein
VSGLGFGCDRASWRVGFTLERAATVIGRLDRRVGVAPLRWAVERRFTPRVVPAGAHALDLGVHVPGIHRVTLGFRTAGGRKATRVRTFAAGCTNPVATLPTPTLPTGTGRQ